MIATDTSSLRALAEWLEISLNSLRLIKECDIVLAPWLRQLALKKSNYRAQWVLTGQGDPFVSGL